MIHLSPESTDRLGELLALASTPTFLVRKFREHFAVQRLASEYTQDEHITTLRRLLSAKRWGLRQQVLAYAVLVSLMTAFPNAVRTVSQLPGFARLKWGEFVLSLAPEYTTGTSVLTMSQTPHIAQEDGLYSSGTTRILLSDIQ